MEHRSSASERDNDSEPALARSAGPLDFSPAAQLRATALRATDRLRWTELHRRLAAHPAFRRCTRAEIRRIARCGDDLAVEAGTLLVEEDTLARWFVVVLDGELDLSRRRRRLARVGSGGHVSSEAVLGFAPQPVTIRTTARCRLFVIGRREFLSVVAGLAGVQAGLLPADETAGYAEWVRRLRAEGNAAWRRLKPAADPATGGNRLPQWITASRKPQASSLGESLVGLAAGAFRRRPPEQGPAPRRPSGVALIPAFGVPVALAVMVALLWHPPVGVVVPGEPIDVSADVSIEGAATSPINGRFVLTPVRVERPNALGLVGAWLERKRTVSLARQHEAPAAIAPVQSFSGSRVQAAVIAARLRALDPAHLRVEFRDRRLRGPSAGLLYGLVVADLLDPADLARGRTIAVTGALAEDGAVLPVSFIDEKASAAERAGAVVFLVPRGQRPSHGDVPAVEVSGLREAVEALRGAPSR